MNPELHIRTNPAESPAVASGAVVGAPVGVMVVVVLGVAVTDASRGILTCMASGNHTGRYTSGRDDASVPAGSAAAGTTATLTPAAARVLDVASRLFYDRGIRAVGVDTIAAAAEVTKKTIYDQFRSKDALITAYLQRRDRWYRDWVTSWITEHPDTDPLLAVFDGLGRWMSEVGPRGCAFVNAFAELSDPVHPAHRIARDHKAWLRDYLAELAAGAGHPDPTTLAARLLTLHEGAIVLYSAGADPAAADTARGAAAALLAPTGQTVTRYPGASGS